MKKIDLNLSPPMKPRSIHFMGFNGIQKRSILSTFRELKICSAITFMEFWSASFVPTFLWMKLVKTEIPLSLFLKRVGFYLTTITARSRTCLKYTD